MARYFLHLRDGADELLDEEGIEIATMEALRHKVLYAVRDTICGDIMRDGLFDLRFRVDAENGSGEVVYSLAYEHAVTIIPAK